MRKSIIYLFLGLFLSFSAQAQQKTYYTVDWEETTKAQAHYYRLTFEPRPKDSLIHVQDFYIDGTIRSDGYVTTLKYHDNYKGRYEDYYPNGQLRYFVNFDSIILKKNGESIWYTSAGEILAKGTYESGHGIEGITRNYTYAARFMQMNADTLVSRINFYGDSKQIAEEYFYRKVPQYGTDNNGEQQVNYWYRLKEVVYYDRKGKEMGRLNYLPNEMIESGTQIFFYKDLHFNLSKKTILHYENEKAEGEEISYNREGDLWLTGVNKDDRHFDGEFLEGNDIVTVDSGKIKKIQYFNRFGKPISIVKYKAGKKWEGLEPAIFINDIYKEGEKIERIEYVNARKEKIKYHKFYSDDDTYLIQWYDSVGHKLDIGKYNEEGIISGLNIIYRMDFTVYTYYLDGKKEGKERLFDSRGRLLAEKDYRYGMVIHDKTLNPITGKMVSCIYLGGSAQEGIFWEFDVESIFEEGYLIQQNEYEKNKLLSATFYEKTTQHFITKKIVYHKGKRKEILYQDGRPIKD